MVYTKKDDMTTWGNNEQINFKKTWHLQDTRLNHVQTSKNKKLKM